MIIRSQDKKRIANISTCNLIDIIDSCKNTKHITADGMILGTYSTEEKAIKVLDMIQEQYQLSIHNCNVFQMPQDSEV